MPSNVDPLQKTNHQIMSKILALFSIKPKMGFKVIRHLMCLDAFCFIGFLAG